jgi:hypothetical protein
MKNVHIKFYPLSNAFDISNFEKTYFKALNKTEVYVEEK